MLKSMMGRMCKSAGIQGHKTNHSVRRTMISQLIDHGVPAHATAELSGHKNVASIANYANPGLQQQHGMSSVLMGESLPRTLPAIAPALSSAALPTSTVTRADNPKTPVVPAIEPSVDMAVSTRDESRQALRPVNNTQENAIYGMFAGAHITGGQIVINIPQK